MAITIQSVQALKVTPLYNNDLRDWIFIEIRNKLPDVQVHTEVQLPEDARLPKAHQRRLDIYVSGLSLSPKLNYKVSILPL